LTLLGAWAGTHRLIKACPIGSAYPFCH